MPSMQPDSPRQYEDEYGVLLLQQRQIEALQREIDELRSERNERRIEESGVMLSPQEVSERDDIASARDTIRCDLVEDDLLEEVDDDWIEPMDSETMERAMRAYSDWFESQQDPRDSEARFDEYADFESGLLRTPAANDSEEV